mmetsp:Transcript_48021/g.104438  ORF Transcript_48021/g.104438 Transcript_48021/m.104438 type:complete len:410 (-) Transcript_48021:19-1248(-)
MRSCLARTMAFTCYGPRRYCLNHVGPRCVRRFADFCFDPRVDRRLAKAMEELPDQDETLPVRPPRDTQQAIMRSMEDGFDPLLGGWQGPPPSYVVQSRTVHRREVELRSVNPTTGAEYLPDIKLVIYSPSRSGPTPTVVYCHGGGMSILHDESANLKATAYVIGSRGLASTFIKCSMSSRIPKKDDSFRALGLLFASAGMTVVFPAFSNSTDRAFPRGLHDCYSALRWAGDNLQDLNSTGQLILAGDSGGANLALATTMLAKQLGYKGVSGCYAMSPFIRGQYPSADCPSHEEFDGYLLTTNAMDLCAQHYTNSEVDAQSPLAWPSLATKDDLSALPPMVISVNEFDPLRSEGENFVSAARSAGVRCEFILNKGTIHTGDLFVSCCPDLAQETASRLRDFAASVSTDDK